MPDSSIPRFTPYPGVNAILQMLLEQVHAVLGDELVGMYLYGSLSEGDFDPASSDIDFVVVTAEELPERVVAALKEMHARISAGGLTWSKKLEGSYIPRPAWRRYNPAYARHPSIGVDWPFGAGEHGPDWIIQRHIVRERGVTLWGPSPAMLIDPVIPADLRRASCDAALHFWSGQLAGPAWLRPRNYQAFAILTMCRILYTLARGETASKPVAAAWARKTLGITWAPLIDRALRWRHDDRPDDMEEMLDFVRYTIERCRMHYAP